MTIPRLYHGASQILTPDTMGLGPLQARGVTVHYTADDDINRVHRTLIETGLGYHLIIGKDGAVTQFTFLDARVAHAGKALWNSMSPNRAHIAIALSSWGKLIYEAKKKTYFAWNRKVIEPIAVASRPAHGSQTRFPWDAATAQQEASLLIVLKWLCSFGIQPKNICGHDECALPAGRKSDPGGILSFTMDELRAKLGEK